MIREKLFLNFDQPQRPHKLFHPENKNQIKFLKGFNKKQKFLLSINKLNYEEQGGNVILHKRDELNIGPNNLYYKPGGPDIFARGSIFKR